MTVSTCVVTGLSPAEINKILRMNGATVSARPSSGVGRGRGQSALPTSTSSASKPRASNANTPKKCQGRPGCPCNRNVAAGRIKYCDGCADKKPSATSSSSSAAPKTGGKGSKSTATTSSSSSTSVSKQCDHYFKDKGKSPVRCLNRFVSNGNQRYCHCHKNK